MKKTNLIILLLLISAGLKAQNRFYVDPNATGNEYGTSWDNAFISIEDAFDNTANGDTIWIKAGRYYPAGDAPSSTFNLPNGIKLYGSFAGDETKLSERDLTKNKTYLDGDVGKKNVDNDNCRTVVTATDLSSLTILDGFIIMNGYHYQVGNTNIYGGGGMRIDDSKINFKNCTIKDNYCYKRGAGIYCTGTNTFEFEDCLFENNHCGDNTSASGGALYMAGSKVTLTNTNFINNSSKNGGAIQDGGSNITADRCVFMGNSATLYYGGALNISGNTRLNIYNSIISGNYAEISGSIVQGGFSSTGYSNFINCTMVGNYNNSDNPNDQAMDIDKNSTIYNCILWDNHATDAIYLGPSAAYSPTVSNCILEGGYTFGSNIDSTAPQLKNPSSSAEAPFTDLPSAYTFGANSPAVNTGINSYLPSKYTLDIMGSLRTVSNTIDIGAIESPYETYKVTVHSGDSTGATVSGTGVYVKDSTATVAVKVISSCFSFKHWEEADTILSYDTMFSFKVLGERNFTAILTQKEYTVSTTVSHPGNSVTGDGTYPCADGVKRTIKASPNACFTFVEWQQNGSTYSTQSTLNIELSEDLNLHAVFNRKLFPVLVGVKSGLGTVDGSGDYACDSLVKLSANPSPGYKFEA